MTPGEFVKLRAFPFSAGTLRISPRASKTARAPEAEIAFEVVDDWQGRGIGKRLVTELRALALAHGILRFRALIAHGNLAAASLVRGLGDLLVHRYEDGAVELVVRIS